MRRKILIVDDSQINRQILCRILSDDYDVVEAENGKEAIEIMRRDYRVISAVLLDIVMPVMDGYELLRQIHSDERLTGVPVIITTGSTCDDAEIRVLTLGANDFITKPYNADIIKRRLQNTIKLREASIMVNTLQRDTLTGLYNRETFFRKAAEMIQEKRAGFYVIACLDIDNFKVINDQYGSGKGDELLKFVADSLERGLSKVGGINCRITADKFASLYPLSAVKTGELDLMRHEAAMFDGSIEPVTISTGCYIIDDKGLSVSAMYDRAAIAKNTVKGRYDTHVAYYNETMRTLLLREQSIVNEMHDALMEEQFEVWLQPQFNHATGTLIGAEALVRWRHPQKGIVSPAEFIPVFERNGFIYELDKYVWEQTCILLKRWMDDDGPPLPVSVNISRYDIFREELINVIMELTGKYKIPVDLLRFEITESAFAKSSDQIIQIVKQLIDKGFTVEIDDFGSGYSSLNTLKDVPAHVLKLDMRFLENNENSTRGGNILESVVRMAKWLGMSVIAEGVETYEQADYLSSIGCFYVQGYLYAKPMPINEYEKFAQSYSKECNMMGIETVQSLDSNAFWDPKTMETLIFNSYVGGACIFEYHNGVTELLRVNKKYAQELGGDAMPVEAAIELQITDYMDEENIAILYNNIENAIRTNAESACEVQLSGIPAQKGDVYIRTTVRVIARAGERMLLYCSVINLTPQRKAEEQIRSAYEQLKFLNNTAQDLLSGTDADTGIKRVLEKILDYFRGDRAYVIESNKQKRIFSNTYEVCASGVSSGMELLQAVPYEAAPFWKLAFENDRYISIDDVDALAGERNGERQLLKEQGIKSLIAVPLHRDGETIGFIGADNPSQQQSGLDHLNAIGDYVAVMLTRRDLNAKIKNDNKMLSDLMNDTPGGFVRIQQFDDGVNVPVYVNEGFCKLVGMKQSEVMYNYRENAMWGVHPEDIGIVESAIAEMMATGEVRSIKYRLKHANGGYIWLMIFGRMTHNSLGETFFNMYYTEMSMT